MNTRIFVEKKQGFRIESKSLKDNLNDNLNLEIKELNIINTYDIFNINESLLKKSILSVFSEVVTDNVYQEMDLSNKKYICIEYLPGTFVQRENAALECISIIEPDNNVKVKYSQLIIIENITSDELKKIKKYYINNVESREKNLNKLEFDNSVDIEDVMYFDNFINLSKSDIEKFRVDLSLAMSFDDLMHIQKYFKNEENRNPSETEILLLDTYWSDHCRHTTFETVLEEITFEKSIISDEISKVFNEYLKMKTELNRDDKPITLMDIATINGRYQKNIGNLDDLEISDEINACSVEIDVDVDGNNEKYLLMFKNETHNHPTEIEPFGGASTCIGGAIRDPLSGRSFVYQAMRISGAANPLEKLQDTIEGKLSQRDIALGSAKGSSSYGNQIGLTTGFVDELYHQGYKAKHMEVGVVVGATPIDNVVRGKVEFGDIVIMLGGRTGRDGVGGATGSSKIHTEESLESASAEVQKGNAPEQRKIQRLFRRKEVSTLIKKANDFGAGGISVAVGEIAESVCIDLDSVKVKYDGLSGTEIAISESQERMAVVIKKIDCKNFIDFCNEENIEAVKIADVTNDNRLIMKYQNKVIVDISREFINTNGIRQSQNLVVGDISNDNVFKRNIYGINLKDKILNNLKDINVSSKKGMIEYFDSTVGASTILMPFGGKYQLSKSPVAVQKIPVLNGHTNTCSVLGYGFNPFISKWSPFHGAAFAVVESISRIVSSGGDFNKIRFTFQEYFEKLSKDPKKWSKPFSSLLGAMSVLNDFNLAAIGGKDSMSGTFKDINVPPTLISFAITTENTKNIISNDLKKIGNYIYIIKHNKTDKLLPNNIQLKDNFNFINELSKRNIIKSSNPVLIGGISQSLFEMAFGSKIGFTIDTELDLFETDYGSIIIETNEEISYKNAIYLGETSKEVIINKNIIDLDVALEYYQDKFSKLYPVTSTENDKKIITNKLSTKNKRIFNSKKIDKVNILIPVFPGMNSEYDMEKSFYNSGGVIRSFIFNNLNKKSIVESIETFVNEIKKSHIIAISGGFSSGDEPDGSGKFISNILNNTNVRKAIKTHLKNGGLILGICNGFQALIKSGLLNVNETNIINKNSPTLFKNDINRHISHITKTIVTTNDSPWLSSFQKNEIQMVPVSHGEGKIVVNEEEALKLFKNNQVAFQYCDDDGVPSMNGKFNPNGSDFAIEGLLSPCGKILGKMGHSERCGSDLYKNIYGNKSQNIFENAINHFKEKI